MNAFAGCRRNAGIGVVGSSKSRRRFRSGRRVVVARRHGGWVEGQWRGSGVPRYHERERVQSQF